MRKKKERLDEDAAREPVELPPPLPPPPVASFDDVRENETPVEVPTPRKASPARPAKWRVAREVLANVNGSFTRLVAGQVLDPLGYSASTIESLRAQGVALEPVE